MGKTTPKLLFEYEGKPHSPFSGKPAEGENGPNARDKTLLLVHYGGGGVYGYISKRGLTAVGAKTQDEVADRAPIALLNKAGIASSVAFVIDTGWNGVNAYGWAPIDMDADSERTK